MVGGMQNNKVDRPAMLAQLKALGQAVAPTRPGLERILTGLAPHVPPARLAAFVERAQALAGGPEGEALEGLLDIIIDGRRVFLWGAALHFQTRPALETIIEEILIRREYHFRSATKAPLVIDAGANIGLATYYAKRMCHAGRVICFEPNPATFALLERNVAAAGWQDVDLHQAALTAEDGETALSVDEEAPLAASVNPRGALLDGRVERVAGRSLRPFLQQPVGLLKLDIEGAEADVLEACRDDLGQVENIFVEVHPVQGAFPSLLLRVLQVLERAGFMIHVSRSPWSESAHAAMPLVQAYRTYSLSVFGTRIGDGA